MWQNLHFVKCSRVLKNDTDPPPHKTEKLPHHIFQSSPEGGRTYAQFYGISSLKGQKERHLTCVNESSRHTPNSLYAVNQASLETSCPNPQKTYTSS